jgi:hypothetical protein
VKWGGDAIFTITSDRKLTLDGYYKLPAPQAETENCVAHNGNLIPVPGRDIQVQAWYQGGISVFDFTDPAHATEIAYFDRGPMDANTLYVAGEWSAYWYNGHIYGSEIARGLDILSLKPSQYLSQNEIDAASLVQVATSNPSDQLRVSWPPSFVVAGAYLDQLERSKGLASDQISTIRTDLDMARQMNTPQQGKALRRLVKRVERDTSSALDPARVQLLLGVIKRLAGMKEAVATAN